MTNTSWWKLALSAPAVVPDFALVARHVCDMPPWADDVALVDERARTNRDIDLLRGNWRYFPAGCRSRGGPAWDAVWKSTTGLGGPHQTSEVSSSVTSKSIRLIFGRIDCSRRVLEAQPKSTAQSVQLRAY
jgi:hypothetical protein